MPIGGVYVLNREIGAVKSIRHKTLAVTAALMVLAAVIALLGLSGTSSLRATFDELGQRAVPSQILLLNIDRDSYQAQLALEQALVAADGETRTAAEEGFAENVAQTTERFAEYEATALGVDGEADRWEAYYAANAAWVAAADALIAATPVGTAIDPAALADERAAFDVARDMIDALGSDIYEQVIPNTTAEVNDMASSQRTQMLVALVACLIAGGLVLRVVIRGLRPLEKLAQSAERMANGDTSIAVDISEADDEVGRLAGAFHNLTTYVQDLSDSLEAMAAGDLSKSPNVRSDQDTLGRSIQTLLGSLRDVVGGLRQAVIHLSGSSKHLVQMSDELGESATNTSMQATAAAAAGQQMHASIREVAHNAAEAVNVSGHAVELAERASSMVARLEQSSEEIGAVLGVITTIAAQTNLLALNATIEAARAGEAGRGFAVVADEVKHLATQTTEATEGVRDRVGAIQADTAQAISSIAEVAAIISTISEHMHGIASAVEEQEATTNEIAQTIEGVANTADSTMSVTTATGMAATELDRLAHQLDDVISRFSGV